MQANINRCNINATANIPLSGEGHAHTIGIVIFNLASARVNKLKEFISISNENSETNTLLSLILGIQSSWVVSKKTSGVSQ